MKCFKIYLGVSLIASSILLAEQKQTLQEVVVTANKIEENPIYIPQNISVFDGEILEEEGVVNLNLLMKKIPNLYSAKSMMGDEIINFRGINPSKFTRNNPIVFYIDGIAQSTSFGFDASLINVERVEVLKGPQGTLYGKDAIGGVINIITKKPTNELKGFIGTEYASENFMLGKFGISTPFIDDKLFFALNTQISKDDGWIKNIHENMHKDANNKKEHKINANLLYQPIDELSIKLSLISNYDKKYWLNGIAIANERDINTATRDEAKEANFDVDSYNEVKTNAGALSLIYNFDKFDLYSTTTYKKLDLKSNFDYDFGNNLAFKNMTMFQDGEFKTFSEELRLSSSDEIDIRWVGGVYLEKDKNKNPTYGQSFYAPPKNDFLEMFTNSNIKSDTAAVFGQVMLPFLSKFELTLGGRYQYLKRKIKADTFMRAFGTSKTPPIYSIDSSTKWNEFLPKIALLYKINENYSSYASISKGYMPGGYNLFISSNNSQKSKFEPEKSINYEIGLKGLFDSGYFNAAVFYMDIKDIHTFKLEKGDIPVTSNAPKAHSMGAELEFGHYFSNNWGVDGAFGIIKTKYDEHTDKRYDGKKIEKTPTHTARIGLSYENPNGVYARFDLRNRGKTYYNESNTIKADAYTLADIKAGYRFSNFDIFAYVKNITDEEYIDFATFYEIKTNVVFGQSRTFGVGFKYSF